MRWEKISHDDDVVVVEAQGAMNKEREEKYEVRKHETFCLFYGAIYGVERERKTLVIIIKIA